MKKRITNLMISALAFLAFSFQAFAAQPIKGSVFYHGDPSKPVTSVVVELYQDGVKIDQTTTKPNGKFIFTNKPFGIYTIKPVTTPITAGGADADDYALIEAIIADEFTPTNIQYLAADIDGNGEVEEADLALWMQSWPYSYNPRWVFEEQVINHNGTKTNLPPSGGSSSGDVNGTFVPTTRTEQVPLVSYIQKKFTPEFSIEIYAKDITSASAMGMVINYPGMVNISNVTSQINDINSLRITENQIIISWANNHLIPAAFNASEPIVVITGKTNNAYNGSDIKFDITGQSHFLVNNEVVRPAFTIPYLSVSSDFLSYSYPNPVNDKSIIHFNLPCDSKATLNVYNQNGQLVKTLVNDDLLAGQHSITFTSQGLKPGIYYYTLKTTGSTPLNESKRLVVVN